MLNFLKKKNQGLKSNVNAPMQNPKFEDLPKPPGPKQEFKPVMQETHDDHPITPQAVQQPIQIKVTNDSLANKKYVQSKEPIDPRDRLDDLIPGSEPSETSPMQKPEEMSLEEKPAPEQSMPEVSPIQEPAPIQKAEPVNEAPEPPTHPDSKEEDFALPSADTIKEKLAGVADLIKSKMSHNPKAEIREEVQESPWAQELQPQTQTVPEPAKDFSLPKEFAPKKVADESHHLPSFSQDIPNAERGLSADLPPKMSFSLYVSINDLAYAKELTKKMNKFFSIADKELEKWENPEKDKLVQTMFLDLDEAQELVIKVDEKLFEGGL